MDVSTLPFNKHLGLRIGPSNDKPTVILRPCAEHLNHVNTVHAAVIYGIAEAASGHCLAVRFPGFVDSFVGLLRSSSAKYRHPAAADREIQAWGVLPEESAVKFYQRLTSRGRATVDVEVTVAQNDTELFTGTFRWFAAARDS